MENIENPFSTGTRRRTDSPYSDPAIQRGIDRGADDLMDAAARQANADPLKQAMGELTTRKTQLGYARQAAEQLRDKFLETEGADLFERDPLSGKLMENPDKSYIPKLGREIEGLRAKTTQKVGLIRGALTSAVAGDPTDDAREAERRLAEMEPLYQAKMQKWERIQMQLNRIKLAHDENEMMLGQVATQSLGKKGVFGTPETDLSMQGSSVAERRTHNAEVAGSIPAPAPTLPAQPATPAATGAAPAAAGITPLALVQMHKQMKEAESIMAMETTNPKLREALKQKRERLALTFGRGMAALPANLQQRVVDITRDPTAWEYVKNFAGRTAEGVGSGLVDMGEFFVRNATKAAHKISVAGSVGLPENPETQAKIKEFSDAMREEAQGWGLSGVPKEVAEKLSEHFSSQVAQGIGSTVSMIAPTTAALRLGQVMGMTEKGLKGVAMAATAATGGAQSGNSMRREAEARFSEMVKAGEITAEEAARGINQAEAIGAFIVGPTEALSPAQRWAKKISGVPAGQTFLKKLGEAAGGGTEAVTKWLRGEGRRYLVDVISEAGEEASQEFAQTFLQNAAARGDMGNVAYDPERDLGEGMAEGAATGGIVGALVSAVLGAGNNSGARRKRIAEAMKRGAEAKPAQPAEAGAQPTQAQPAVQPAAEGAEPVPGMVRWTFTDAAGKEMTVEGTGVADAKKRLPAGFEPDLSKPVRQSAAVNSPATVEGEPFDKEWSAFAPESGSLGIPRAEMPQVKAEHRGALTNFLSAKNIISEEDEVLPGDLKPTQAEYSPAKVDKARKFEGGDRAILVSADGYVVDGHHQWMAKLTDKPTEPMRVIRLDAPIKDVLEQVKQFPSAKTAGGATTSQPAAPAPGSTSGRGASGNLPQGPTVAAGKPSPDAQKETLPTESGQTPQVGGAKPASAQPGAGKRPVIASGENTPANFHAGVSKAVGVKAGSKAHRFLADFSSRLQRAAPEAFKAMEVRVLSQAEWDADARLGLFTPDSSGAYDAGTNTLYINSDKSRGDEVINTIVHEAGHFAEKFALGEEFTQRQWESLTDEQRRQAYRAYAQDPKAVAALAPDSLKTNRQARKEWVAMQFARVVRGDTEGMNAGLKARLEQFLKDVRELVNRWIGDGKLTTRELDARIIEMLGYGEAPTGGRTQEDLVREALKTGPKTANELAEELGIINHNVRRILGEGTKAGKFERIARGVYAMKNPNGSFIYVQSTDAVAALPELAKRGVKADFVFLDPPYKTVALVGGNRGVKDYAFITPEQFSTVVGAAKAMMRTADAPIYYMFSQAPSGLREMARYTRVFEENGLKLVAKGAWRKTFKDGSPVTNPRGEIAAPEGIALFNASGKMPGETLPALDFTMVRPPVTGEGGRQSQKPVELYNRLLGFHTKDVPEAERPRFIAIDPFAGTGGLGVAAQSQGASAILFEIQEDVIEKFIGPKLEAGAKKAPGPAAPAAPVAGWEPPPPASADRPAQNEPASGGDATERQTETESRSEPEIRGSRRKIIEQNKLIRALEQRAERMEQANPKQAAKLRERIVEERTALAKLIETKRDGKTPQVGYAPNGEPDILSDIAQHVGRIRTSRPDNQSSDGGEYDGWEVLNFGAARLLRGGKVGVDPDEALAIINESGYNIDGISAFQDAISRAVNNRRRLAEAMQVQDYQQKVEAAALTNEGRSPAQKPKEGVPIEEIGVGGQFKIRGEKFSVVDTEEGPGGTVIYVIQDGYKFTVPEGTMFYPDRNSLKKAKVEKAKGKPSIEDDPFFGEEKPAANKPTASAAPEANIENLSAEERAEIEALEKELGEKIQKRDVQGTPAVSTRPEKLTVKRISHATGDIIESTLDLSQSERVAAESQAAVKKYEALLECVSR